MAKDLLDNGHIYSNERPVKASYMTRKGDKIRIQKGSFSIILEVLDIPARNLKKEERPLYYRVISKESDIAGLDE